LENILNFGIIQTKLKRPTRGIFLQKISFLCDIVSEEKMFKEMFKEI
jgi:hypothetical protein